ncbi:sensor histidine kinase [Tenacibaculum agarivorans]|uniref:sensor histidine kinase n=1 Tax=Tenacibaculum agarivorans TaxID=1908389 RepID=UPI00094BBC19|nr:histidine kinase [Tenacibaculum agarivorans]
MLSVKHIYNYLIKYKVHHILFWALYHIFWWTLYTGDIFSILKTLITPHGLIKFLGYVLFQALGVYFSLYYLIPKFLKKRAYFYFFISLLGVLFTESLLITLNYYFASSFTNQTVYEVFKISPPSAITIFKRNAFPSCVASLTLGMTIKLSKNWLASQKLQQVLEKEKLETELKFLKSQFNPHFLFNTINSIFVLIDKNTEMASESLVKFSNLLRYQLYECNAEFISLKEEIKYIQSFIELESLRQNTNFNLKESYPIDCNNLHVAPFILIPFVENAFKHVSENQKKKKWISIEIKVENDTIEFNIRNSTNQQANMLLNDCIYKGLGLKNVKRRLDLLYPRQYKLDINKIEEEYKISLRITLVRDLQITQKDIVYD